MSEETVLKSERIYEGKILNLRVDHVQLPGGAEVRREIVEHRGAVAVVAVDDEEYVYLVRQHRTAVGATLLELPAGMLEPGEEPANTAQRELQEEIGMFPGELESLGSFLLAPGYSTERLYLFAARQLRPARLPADEDEAIVVEKILFTSCLDLIDQGQIEDAKTIAGVLRFARYRASKGDNS